MSRKEFPTYGLLPKQETEALTFLKKYPECDGRGILIAILDTGVDPACEGMQTTTDGQPKLVDIVDTTGSGDVDMSTIVEAEGNIIHGLSGRKLIISEKWNNPSGKYRLGIKRGYEIFPKPLVSRLQEERKKKWDLKQHQLLTSIKREILLKKDDGDKSQEFEDRLAQLQEMQKNYDDPGPIYDVVAFHDGSVWRVVVDTNESCDLTKSPLLTDYWREQQFTFFGPDSLLSFSVSIYDEGNTVTLVSTSGTHGTHVASIVAGYYPNQPELNGVAPGAQLISIKIGDSRLGTMETIPALVRALSVISQYKCDMANLSYGEATSVPNEGRFTDLLNQLVQKGLIFVAAAGNNGPCLSTSGAPGSTTSSVFGIGACITPGLMEAAHSLIELPNKTTQTNPSGFGSNVATPYPWSSRGPNFDGHLGVCVSAIGGAIAGVPQWALQKNQLMEGTSMASPNCCGGIALILSAMKKNNLSYSPFSIRRAIENTAITPPGTDAFSIGNGLLQIDKAFTHLNKFPDQPYRNIQMEVNVIDNVATMRGIYLREAHETNQMIQKVVKVRPNFLEADDSFDMNPLKVSFELKIALVATQPWVTCPDHLILMHGGRQFSVRVDPCQLSPGAHYAEVQGFDLSCPEFGPIFRVPITVVQSQSIPLNGNQGCTFGVENLKIFPGELKRYFLNIPLGATWIDFTLKGHNFDRPRHYIVQGIQKALYHTHSDNEFHQAIPLSQDQFQKSFPVNQGTTLELCIGQYWSSLGQSEISFEVSFHGLLPSEKNIVIHGSSPISRVDVQATIRAEEVTPSVSLEYLRKSFRPNDSQIKPLSERDIMVDTKQSFELMLSYNFKVSEATEISPRVPLFNDLLYENMYEGQFWMLFDSNKKYIASGDAFLEKVKVTKGQYTLKLQIRHENLEMLEKVQDMILLIDFKLKDKVTVPCYADLLNSRTEKKKFDSKKLTRGETCAVYINASIRDKVPKDAVFGDILVGNIKYEKKTTKGYEFLYVVGPLKESKITDNSQTKSKPQFTEEVKEAKLQLLKKFKDSEKEKLHELIQEFSQDLENYLPFLQFKLQILDQKDYSAIISTVDEIVKTIDKTELAAFFGTKQVDKGNDLTEKKKMEEIKTILIDCLKSKALAQSELIQTTEDIEQKNLLLSSFEETCTQLEQWTDLTSSQFIQIVIAQKQFKENYGGALKSLHKYLSEADPSPDQQFFELRRKLLTKLGWDHWDEYEAKWNMLRFPKGYAKF